MPENDTALLRLESILQQATSIGLGWSQRRAELSLDEKSLGQFASNADIELETFIRDGLNSEFPGQAVIGEEFGGSLTETKSGWAIDPIDGTSNFVLGLPIWAISIGYLEAGRSVLGAIALPELGLTLSAADGHGLRVNQAPAPLSKGPCRVKMLSLGENDFEPGPETDAKAQVFRDQDYAVVRYRCAVFSLAMAALGRLNGYVEYGCGLWDIAAGEVICREAGLQVKTANIAPGRYAIDARWAE